jgi:sugar lactone lactonase YvrE
MEPMNKGDWQLFVADFDGSIDVFKYNDYSNPVAKITDGVSQPKGTAIDKSGNLYVTSASNENVTVYPPGQTEPSRTLSGGIYDPQGVAVAGDGTVYVVNACCDSTDQPSEVVVFAPGSNTPTNYLKIPAGTGTFDAFDAAGNLYVSAQGAGNPGGVVYEYKKGSGEAENLSLQGLGMAAEGIAFDKNGNLIVSDFYNDVVDVFPPNKTKPSRQFALSSFPYALTLSKNRKQLFVSTSSEVLNFNYTNGKLKQTISGFGIAEGPAFSPAAQP